MQIIFCDFHCIAWAKRNDQIQPTYSMFKPPLIMTGRSVFGANPNRAGNDEYFMRLKEMHNRGGYKNEMFHDSVSVGGDLLDDGKVVWNL